MLIFVCMCVHSKNNISYLSFFFIFFYISILFVLIFCLPIIIKKYYHYFNTHEFIFSFFEAGRIQNHTLYIYIYIYIYIYRKTKQEK